MCLQGVGVVGLLLVCSLPLTGWGAWAVLMDHYLRTRYGIGYLGCAMASCAVTATGPCAAMGSCCYAPGAVHRVCMQAMGLGRR